MSARGAETLVHRDRWLSGILGRDALGIDARASNCDLSSLACRLSEEPLFVTAKIPTSEPVLVKELENMGFHVVDTALTFHGEHFVGSASQGARFATPEDHDCIVEIAGSAFKFSRFHLDPAFPTSLANRIKAEWAASYFSGQRGDAMITIEADGRLAGFLLLVKGAAGAVVIDLIAVAPAFERRGMARSMISFAANHGLGNGIRPVAMLVGTQAVNTPSVNLYEAAGFRLSSSAFVLHHHGIGTSYE